MSVDKTASWQERADSLARTLRLNVETDRLARPGMTAEQMAAALPEDLRSLYWQRRLDAYFADELGEDS